MDKTGAQRLRWTCPTCPASRAKPCWRRARPWAPRMQWIDGNWKWLGCGATDWKCFFFWFNGCAPEHSLLMSSLNPEIWILIGFSRIFMGSQWELTIGFDNQWYKARPSWEDDPILGLAHTVHPPLGISVLNGVRVWRTSNDICLLLCMFSEHLMTDSSSVLLNSSAEDGKVLLHSVCFIHYSFQWNHHLFLSSWLSQHWNPEIPQRLRLISLSSFSPVKTPF